MQANRVSAKSSNTLEIVVYLASLVSDPTAIDPTLDKIRAITSQRRAGEAFTAQDEQTFEGVRQQLVKYLTHDDPVRSFTVESLQQRIQEHFAPVDQLRTQRWVLSGVWTAAISLSILATIAPIQIDPIVRQQLSAVAILSVLGLGAAWFFITALRDFKPELRPAYRLLCLSALLISLGELQLPLIPAFDLGDHPLFLYGGFTVPFAVAIAFTFVGLRTYAKTINISSRLLQVPVVVGPALLLAVAVAAMPHGPRLQYEGFFDMSMVAIATEIYMATIGFVLTRYIVAKTVELYARAIRLLGWMLIFSVVGSAAQFVILLTQGQLKGVAQLLTAVPFIISQIFLLYAAYAFKRTSRY